MGAVRGHGDRFLEAEDLWEAIQSELDEHRLEAREGQDAQEVEEQDRSGLPQPECFDHRIEAEAARGVRAMAFGFLKPDHADDRSDEREPRGQESRRAHADADHLATDEWTERESEAESGADDPHPLGPVLRGRHVRDVGLGRRHVRAEEAREHA